MNPRIALLVCLLFAGYLHAQNKVETPAPYQKDNHIPAFNILLTDSSFFTPAQLPKSDYTVIIYFSPDCGHCQIMAKELVKNIDSLRNAFFVMVAYKSLEDIKGFAGYYGLDKIPNLRLGRDQNYFVPAFYRVESTPFAAVYNSNLKLIKVYDPPHRPVMEIPELIALIHQN